MNIEKVTRLSNVQKKKRDNVSEKHFLKNNNETIKQEQNICLNSKKNLCMEKVLKQNSDWKSNFSQHKVAT